MGLFFDILSAINNPNQQGSVDQLSAIVNATQQLGVSNGLDTAATQTVLSTLGGFLRPALQQQIAGAGDADFEALLRQPAGSAFSSGEPETRQSFLTPSLQQQMVEGIAHSTGLPTTTLHAVLPGLISVALGFLSLGANTAGTAGENPVLKTFLTPDRGSADLGEVFKFAHRFLNPPQ